MKKRSVATSHAPFFLGLLEMGLREQGRFRQAGTRPQAALPLGEPTGHFAAKRKVSEWVIYFMEVYDRAHPGPALCIDILRKPTDTETALAVQSHFGPCWPEVPFYPVAHRKVSEISR